jgi:vacuolar protein sorting-associated protein 13A/C
VDDYRKKEERDRDPFQAFFKQTVGDFPLVDVDRAELALPGRRLDETHAQLPVLLDRLKGYYMASLKSEAPSLLGSANMLGNPVGFFNSLSNGLNALVEEPIEAVAAGDFVPFDLAFGVTKGAGKLVANTIKGVGSSAQGITRSMGKGLAKATFDREYQEKRARAMHADKASNPIEGLFYGGKHLSKGVFKGLTGLVTEPVKGAEKHGLKGFFQGVGRGVVGVVVKPVTGAVDAVSKVSEGLSFEREEKSKHKRIYYKATSSDRYATTRTKQSMSAHNPFSSPSLTSLSCVQGTTRDGRQGGRLTTAAPAVLNALLF